MFHACRESAADGRAVLFGFFGVIWVFKSDSIAARQSPGITADLQRGDLYIVARAQHVVVIAPAVGHKCPSPVHRRS